MNKQTINNKGYEMIPDLTNIETIYTKNILLVDKNNVIYDYVYFTTDGNKWKTKTKFYVDENKFTKIAFGGLYGNEHGRVDHIIFNNNTNRYHFRIVTHKNRDQMIDNKNYYTSSLIYFDTTFSIDEFTKLVITKELYILRPNFSDTNRINNNLTNEIQSLKAETLTCSFDSYSYHKVKVTTSAEIVLSKEEDIKTNTLTNVIPNTVTNTLITDLYSLSVIKQANLYVYHNILVGSELDGVICEDCGSEHGTSYNVSVMIVSKRGLSTNELNTAYQKAKEAARRKYNIDLSLGYYKLFSFSTNEEDAYLSIGLDENNQEIYRFSKSMGNYKTADGWINKKQAKKLLDGNDTVYIVNIGSLNSEREYS